MPLVPRLPVPATIPPLRPRPPLLLWLKRGSIFDCNSSLAGRASCLRHHFSAQLNVNNLLGEDSEQDNNYTWQRPVEARSYVTTVTMEW